jgi:hypothetical protein
VTELPSTNRFLSASPRASGRQIAAPNKPTTSVMAATIGALPSDRLNEVSSGETIHAIGSRFPKSLGTERVAPAPRLLLRSFGRRIGYYASIEMSSPCHL